MRSALYSLCLLVLLNGCAHSRHFERMQNCVVEMDSKGQWLLGCIDSAGAAYPLQFADPKSADLICFPSAEFLHHEEVCREK